MRLLLVEDDATIAHELALRWQRLGWTVAHCATLAAADTSRCAEADLVVLDLGLPDGDGMDWLSALRQVNRSLAVLILTARDGVAERVAGLRSGADDYLVKPFAPEELDARIEVLARRAAMDYGESAHFGRLSWHPREGRAYASGHPLDLSPREFEVLGLLIRRAPRLLMKRALIDALAETNLDVGDAAAELYVSRLRRKLAGSGAEIRTLRGFGYQLALRGEADA